LTHEYGIKTIIDLRSKTEHINQAKKRDASISSSEVVPQTESRITEPLKIPGIRYYEINLNGASFEKALMKKLRWSSLGKLVALMAFGYRNEAISILGREVMQPRGLTGLGIDTLDNSGDEILHVFDVLADSQQYPIIVHCTQGKDRTGLIILLVLLLVAAPRECISKDYVMSEAELQPEKEERMKEISSIGLTEDFAGCPPDFVEKLANHLEQRYGGVEGYLKTIRVTSEQQQQVRNILLR